MSVTRIITISLILLFSWLLFTIAKNSTATLTESEQYKLGSAVISEHRDANNKARDIYRNPGKTLAFFGIQSDMTVVEIWPGKGWYTEIIAPFIKHGQGQFIAAGFPQNAGPEWRQNMQHDYQQWLEQSPEFYDQVSVVELGPPSYWKIAPDESVDAILTFRNVHNWLKGGYETEMFHTFYAALKPGGVLGVTDHRAKADTDIETMKKSGYLTEKLVISLAEQAGFELEARSETNANSFDDTRHPKGVWTLPPTLRLGEQDREKYLTIGESDRMTLRFRKPTETSPINSKE
ncbi:MAG: class I SAM-dependent methyltransferase [Methylophaga sp.]|nr:class I SAM-dependent methyltransferase [Methylophaga sp.]